MGNVVNGTPAGATYTNATTATLSITGLPQQELINIIVISQIVVAETILHQMLPHLQ